VNELNTTTDYRNWLKDLKLRVRQAQLTAAVQVNSTLLMFYWELGADIADCEEETG